MATRATAGSTIVESSHADATRAVTSDQPVFTAPPGRSAGHTPGVQQRGAAAAADDPRRTMRALVRRWRLLALSVLVGGALGWLSAIVAVDSNPAPIPVDHYQAAHIIVLDGNIPDTQTVLGVRNLNTLAKRVTAGEIPTRVAERTGMRLSDATNQVRVIIRSDSEVIEIIAIGSTPGEAEELADLYAEELFLHLESEAQAYAAEAISSAEARLADAEGNLTVTFGELQAAEVTGDDELIERLQQDYQQYESARIFSNATLLDLQSDGVPLVPLESLQQASGRSTVIANARFDELRDRAAAGQNIELLFGDEAEPQESNGALSAVSSRLPNGVVPRLGIGALAGMFVGLITAMFLNRLDNRIRSKRQVEELLDLPVLAEVPTLDRNERKATTVVSHERPLSSFAEQHRGLASTIMYAGRTRTTSGSQVVLVTSPGPAEGKTTTVANIGAMLAEAGHSVLLVNGDFRRPALHRYLDTPDTSLQIHRSSVVALDVVSNVVGDQTVPPTEVVATQRMVIEEAHGLYDFIVIDTAPLIATNDSLDLLDLVDDVVLVLRAGRTTAHAADRAAELLERRRSHVLGIAITGVDVRTAEDYYYYGSYYDEASSGPRGPRASEPVAERSADVQNMLDAERTIDVDRLFSHLRRKRARAEGVLVNASDSPADVDGAA